MFWRRRKIGKDLKAVTEVAGDQITPGLGTFALVLGGIAVAGVTAYAVHRKRQGKNKKVPRANAQQVGGDPADRQR